LVSPRGESFIDDVKPREGEMEGHSVSLFHFFVLFNSFFFYSMTVQRSILDEYMVQASVDKGAEFIEHTLVKRIHFSHTTRKWVLKLQNVGKLG